MKEQEESKRITDSAKGAMEQVISSPPHKNLPKVRSIPTGNLLYKFKLSNSNTYSIFQVSYISKYISSP